MELYKKYRPKAFKGVIGNEDTKTALQSKCSNNSVPHFILLVGPSGCGKTTIARIMQKKLNCSDYDFNEINCADFRGIDTVRSVIASMAALPLDGSSKIWLIDEAHKLSNDAQNAFLKALEDTPSHVYFIFCTTNVDKLINTIRTRASRFDVKPLTDAQMKKLISTVVLREKLSVPDEVVDEILFSSNGSPRMALVLLEKISSLSESDMASAIEEYIKDTDSVRAICKAIIKGSNWPTIVKHLKKTEAEPEQIRRAILGYMSAVLLNSRGDALMRASIAIDMLEQPFYDSGAPGLHNAIYRITEEING